MDSTQRFTGRANDYTRYRPSYPETVLEYIIGEFGYNSHSTAADIGAGTGIFTGLLLPRVGAVYAVEPNREMRGEAEKSLKGQPGFVSVDGTAEDTTLDAGSVDFITAAQAFHWFDLEKSHYEFSRILKKGNLVFLIWNKRLKDTDFLHQYETIIRENIPEYAKDSHHTINDGILGDFFCGSFGKRKFAHSQDFDRESVIGRFNSSSYTPPRESPLYRMMEARILKSFEENARNGYVRFNYETELYFGRIE